MKKHEVITFKVDESLMEIMKTIPNRSEFIRHAILQALDNLCPLCQGTGIFSPSKKRHWEDFIKNHSMKRCEECDEVMFLCSSENEAVEHVHESD